MRLADYVMDALADQGIEDLFLVSGGGIMHLLDAVGRSKRLRYVCNHHEQASAIAAEAYARVRGGLGACLVTTGPGAANALSGVVGAWFDSIPVVVISGQVRTQILADYERVRQLGPQEINILPMVRPVTKFAAQIRRPEEIAPTLARAIHEATSGRPGPVWIDVPLDMQGAEIPEGALAAQRIEDDPLPLPVAEAAQVADLLATARRPVLVCGSGVRLAGGVPDLLALLEETGIPVLLPLGGVDLVPESYRAHMGAFGPVGRRAANFALQNADLLVAVGAGMSISAIGFNTAGFAPRARKVIVNVDPHEMTKGSFRPDLAIAADARTFLRALRAAVAGRRVRGTDRWREACARWKERYPAVLPEARADEKWVSTYAFVDRLSEVLAEDEVVVTGNSLDACTVYQAFRVRKGQRVLISVNCGAMGWDLPAAVGAAVARRGQRVVLVTGDGSLQFNVQELQTIRVNALPVKIFVVSNEGYESIRFTQSSYFEGLFVGSDFASGIGNPDFGLLARAYGMDYLRVATNSGLESIRAFLDAPGPGLCELMVSPAQGRTPKLSSFRREDGTLESRPLEDMYPFLPREEVHENMHLFDDEP